MAESRVELNPFNLTVHRLHIQILRLKVSMPLNITRHATVTKIQMLGQSGSTQGERAAGWKNNLSIRNQSTNGAPSYEKKAIVF